MQAPQARLIAERARPASAWAQTPGRGVNAVARVVSVSCAFAAKTTGAPVRNMAQPSVFMKSQLLGGAAGVERAAEDQGGVANDITDDLEAPGAGTQTSTKAGEWSLPSRLGCRKEVGVDRGVERGNHRKVVTVLFKSGATIRLAFFLSKHLRRRHGRARTAKHRCRCRRPLRRGRSARTSLSWMCSTGSSAKFTSSAGDRDRYPACPAIAELNVACSLTVAAG